MKIRVLKVHGSLNWLYCPVWQMVLTPGKGATKLFYISKIRSRNFHIAVDYEGNYVPVLTTNLF